MAAAIDPYVPNLVPQSGEIKDLERYLGEEFQRVAVAIRGSAVQSAYCGLAITAPHTDVANIAPHQIVDFDAFVPNQPNRITPLPPGFDSLNVLEDGVYYACCQFTVDIQSGRVYNITMYVNGVASPVFGTFDTSNQTDTIIMTFIGMVELKAGDEVQVWVNSTQDGSTFDLQSGVFMLFRISELIKVF